MTGEETDTDGQLADEEFERREVIQAAGIASIPAWARGEETALGGGAGELDGPEASMEPTAQRSSSTLEIGPNLDLGGRLVVGAPDAVGYDTIEAAWDAAEDGDIVFLHGSYDAERAGEEFPVTLDYTQKEVMLSGGHPSGSVIDARHVPEQNVVEVLGKGSDDYRNKALVQHLKIRGGNVGLRVRGAPYSTYKDVTVHQASDDGFRVEEYTDPSGRDKGAFGIAFRNCMAWRNGGAGFRLRPGAAPHATTFYGCHALFNGLERDEPGVQLRGYASRWANGVVQNNGGYGIDARAGASQGVNDTYFEGNGMAQEYPHEIYVSETSPGFVLKGSYFNGVYSRDAPNGKDQAYRGVAIAGGQGAELSACTFKNYTDAFLHLRQTMDADAHLATHTGLDDTELQNSWNNTRLRSSGMILETDLRGTDPAGRYTGDYGIHDGAGQSPWGFAVWDGSDWISVMNGKVIR